MVVGVCVALRLGFPPFNARSSKCGVAYHTFIDRRAVHNLLPYIRDSGKDTGCSVTKMLILLNFGVELVVVAEKTSF